MFCLAPIAHRFRPARLLPLAAMLSLSTAALPGHAAESADAYPSKPIRFIVPFTAGGLTDKLSRAVAQELHAAWKQPVIVENRAGAGGTVGAETTATSPADGYTIMLGSHATHAINVTLLEKLPYDAVKDFEPVSLLATVPNVLLVNPSVPANSVPELIKLAKAKPGSLNFSSQGIGTSGHMCGELFKALAGVDMVHVPARGPAQAISDVMGGHVDLLFDSVAISKPLIQGGKLKGLAVTSKERSAALPGLPTMVEAGVPDYEMVLWFGVFAPKGTPAPIVEKLNREIVRAMRSDVVRNAFVNDGVTVAASSQAELARFQKAEIDKWAKLITSLGIRAN